MVQDRDIFTMADQYDLSKGPRTLNDC